MAVAPLTTAKTYLYLDALYAYARAVNERRLMARADPELLAMLALKDYVAQALILYRSWGTLAERESAERP